MYELARCDNSDLSAGLSIFFFFNFQGENGASFWTRQKRWFYKFLMVVKNGVSQIEGDPVLH